MSAVDVRRVGPGASKTLARVLGSAWTRRASVGIAAVAALAGLMPGPAFRAREADAGSCPSGMASIGGKYCIDKYEASTEEGSKNAKGKFSVAKRHSPYKPVTGLTVKAVSIKGRVPQGYISRDEAEEACENAGKRLCTDDEWIEACKGKTPTQYPYGDEHEDGYCNDAGLSSFNLLFGPGGNKPAEASAYNGPNMNDERINEMDGTVAPSGKFAKCRNSYGVYDMVGNLHEWTADTAGTFRGGYYLDTHINGDGCDYRTTAHDHLYHDYSTGFRCCYGGEEQKKLAKKKKDAVDAKKDGDADASASASAEDDAKSKSKSKSKSKAKKSDADGDAKASSKRGDAAADKKNDKKKPKKKKKKATKA